MVSILLAISLASTAFPPTLEEIEPWADSRTDEAVWESLETLDPNDPRSIRLLDLSLGRFRSREQVFLFKKWSDHFAQSRPGTALGLQALAWKSWMAPDRIADEAPPTVLLDRIQGERYEPQWGIIAETFPNDLSGILAARLLGAGLGDRPAKLDEIRSASPESGVSALLLLQEGSRLADYEDWDRAVDRWLEGIARYPVEWERPEWVARIVAGLRRRGHGVQADIAARGVEEELRDLRQFRVAVEAAQRGDLAVATESLNSLMNDPRIADALKGLCQTHLALLRDTGADSEVFATLSKGNSDDIRAIFSGLTSQAPSLELGRRISSIADWRSDQGQVQEAVLIWETLANWFPPNSEIAVSAYDRLLALHWKRFEAMRELKSAASAKESDPLFAPIESTRDVKILNELEGVLERAEVVAASAPYSTALIPVLAKLYQIHANLGHSGRPADLFHALALRAPAQERAELARIAQKFRPEEAISILRIESEGAEQKLDSGQKEVLLALYEEKEQYKEAAALARAIAEEASGTPLARKAWYKTAWLEYKSGDYRSSEKTLEELLPQQAPGSLEQTETQRLLALSNYQSGDYEGSREYFDAALESGLLGKGEQEELAILNAYSYLYRQEYDGARARLESILDSNPSRLVERRVHRLVQQLAGHN